MSLRLLTDAAFTDVAQLRFLRTDCFEARAFVDRDLLGAGKFEHSGENRSTAMLGLLDTLLDIIGGP